MGYELFIASRYLKVKHQFSFISLITVLSVSGVAIGVMALIIVIAVMAGFESDFKKRILDVKSHLVIERKKNSFTDYERIAQVAEEIKGVKGALPFVDTQVMLRSNIHSTGALLKGVDPKHARHMMPYIPDEALAQLGSEGKKNAPPGVILGTELARLLGVLKGDTVHLISPMGILSPIGHMPSMKKFLVVGYFESGMYEYDANYAFVHLEKAQRIGRLRGAVSGIEVQLKDIYSAKKIGAQVVEALDASYVAKDWMMMNKTLFSALKLEKTAMFIILVLIVLVAALNISGSLVMMVMEKTKDIAILEAMGASRKSIGKIFVLKGMVIGTIGILFGIVSGVGICWGLKKYEFVQLPGDVYYITTLPVQLNGLDIALISLSAWGICFLASIYPAIKASKLDPVEAIRFG